MPTTEDTGDTEDTTTPSSECRCGEANRALKIVGGVATEKNEYPWQVLVYTTYMPFGFCGGSILSSRTILTAAHCFHGEPVEDHTVVLAEHDWTVTGDGEQRMKVCDRVDHPKYNSGTRFNFDIAILTLCEDIVFKKTASPVCLPSQPESDYANAPAIVSGWGHNVSQGFNQLEQLMEVDVNTITNTECKATDYSPSEITDSMICASNPGKDSCQNDSGGPLITDEGGYYSQIGVVSWGIGCADSDYPGVYARVTSAERFIQDNMSGTICPPPQMKFA